jgi:hypothetical protein
VRPADVDVDYVSAAVGCAVAQVNLESKSLNLPQAKAKGTFVQAVKLGDIKGEPQGCCCCCCCCMYLAVL